MMWNVNGIVCIWSPTCPCCIILKGKAFSSFFVKLGFIINNFTSSSKSNDKLSDAQAVEIAKMIGMHELESGNNLNQAYTWQWIGVYTLSPFPIYSKCWMQFCHVLDNISTRRRTFLQYGDADYVRMTIPVANFWSMSLKIFWTPCTLP